MEFCGSSRIPQPHARGVSRNGSLAYNTFFLHVIRLRQRKRIYTGVISQLLAACTMLTDSIADEKLLYIFLQVLILASRRRGYSETRCSLECFPHIPRCMYGAHRIGSLISSRRRRTAASSAYAISSGLIYSDSALNTSSYSDLAILGPSTSSIDLP
jgi:hypothetical protein